MPCYMVATNNSQNANLVFFCFVFKARGIPIKLFFYVFYHYQHNNEFRLYCHLLLNLKQGRKLHLHFIAHICEDVRQPGEAVPSFPLQLTGESSRIF